MKKNIRISPSLLAADFTDLKNEVKKITEGNADWLHLDIMDGAFVPNISFGPAVVKSLRPLTNVFFDVHLMINDPIRYIEHFANAGAEMITFHIESCDNPKEVIDKIHSFGIKAGVSVKPKTKADAIKDILPLVDMVLVMTVEPGFGGQKYMSDMEPKISEIKEMIEAIGKDIDIQVDGGISKDTIATASKAGANVFVAGTAVFKAQNTKETISELKRIASEA